MMICEFCGAEYTTQKALSQHMRMKHPSGGVAPPTNTTTAPIGVDIEGELLKTIQAIKSAIVINVLRGDPAAIKQLNNLNVATGQTPEQNPTQQLRDTLSLMKEFREAMPERESTGKTWPDVLVESIPTVMEGIKGINKQNQGKEKPKTKQEETALEREIIRKELELQKEAQNEPRSNETGSEGGDQAIEGVSAETTPKTA